MMLCQGYEFEQERPTVVNCNKYSIERSLFYNKTNLRSEQTGADRTDADVPSAASVVGV